MAAKKKTPPMTAEMKAARASIRQATLLGVEQTQQRVRAVSRGAFGTRKLRAGGASSLQGYELGKYKSDPFPTPTGGYIQQPGLTLPPPRRSAAPKASAKPKATPKKKPTARKNPLPPNPRSRSIPV